MKSLRTALVQLIHQNLGLSPMSALSLIHPGETTRAVLRDLPPHTHPELRALQALHEWRAEPEGRLMIHDALGDLITVIDGARVTLPSVLAGVIVTQVRGEQATWPDQPQASLNSSAPLPLTEPHVRPQRSLSGAELIAQVIISELLSDDPEGDDAAQENTESTATRPSGAVRSGTLLYTWASHQTMLGPRARIAQELCLLASPLACSAVDWSAVFRSVTDPQGRGALLTSLTSLPLDTALLRRTMERLWQEYPVAAPPLRQAGDLLRLSRNAQAQNGQAQHPTDLTLIAGLLRGAQAQLSGQNLLELIAALNVPADLNGSLPGDAHEETLTWLMLAGSLGDGSRVQIGQPARAINASERLMLDSQLRPSLEAGLNMTLHHTADLAARLLQSLTTALRTGGEQATAQALGNGGTPEQAAEFLIGAGQQLDEWMLGLTEERRTLIRRGYTAARAALREVRAQAREQAQD